MTTMPNFAVQLRSKAINGLGLKHDHSAQNKLANSIVCFRGSSYKDALKTIFALIYNTEIREEILRQYGFTSSQEEFEKYIVLTDEQIVTLGNELRYQYKLSHPNFLEVESQPGYQEELETLRKAMCNHPVLFYRAVEACEKCHDSCDIVNCSVELLMSENADSQKYGLQKLGNNAQYQRLLQPYADKIGALLQAMHNNYEEHLRILAEQEERNKFPSPFAQLSDMIRQKQENSSAAEVAQPCCESTANDQSNEHSAEISNYFSKYSLSDELSRFIKNKSEVARNLPRDDEFWSCLKRLRDLGINLNALVDNELYLWPILEAHNALDDAISALYDAEEDFKEAQKNFKMGDFKTIEHLFKIGKAREEAKVAYNIAFDSFVKYCQAYENFANK